MFSNVSLWDSVAIEDVSHDVMELFTKTLMADKNVHHFTDDIFKKKFHKWQFVVFWLDKI